MGIMRPNSPGFGLYEKYMFFLLNHLEEAYLMPQAPEPRRAERNLRRHLALAESARSNLNLINKLAEARHGAGTLVPSISRVQGNC
jgi:hypothetical protein